MDDSVYFDEVYEFASESNPTKTYKVRQRKDTGQLVCSCPAFIFQRVTLEEKKPCKHINEVQSGVCVPVGGQRKPEPVFTLTMNYQVTPVMDDNGNVVEVQVPLIPIGSDKYSTWFEATLIYDLLRYGVSLRTIKERNYGLIETNPVKDIIKYVRERGRLIWSAKTMETVEDENGKPVQLYVPYQDRFAFGTNPELPDGLPL